MIETQPGLAEPVDVSQPVAVPGMEMAPAEVRSHDEVWTLSRRWGGFLQDIKFALPLLVVDVVVSFALLVGVWQFTRSFLDHSLSSQLALTGLVKPSSSDFVLPPSVSIAISACIPYRNWNGW